jgi:hypothetical protein
VFYENTPYLHITIKSMSKNVKKNEDAVVVDTNEKKKAIVKDMLKIHTDVQNKKSEIKTMTTNLKELQAALSVIMVKGKDPYIDCGKHGFIELKKSGKVEKNARLEICSKFFDNNTVKASQFILYEKQETERLKMEACKKDPQFSVNVAVKEKEMEKMRSRYCPKQTNIFDGVK